MCGLKWPGQHHRTAIDLSLLLTVILQLLIASANAQTSVEIENRHEASWEFGYELLQMLVEERGLNAVVSWDEIEADPENAVVIMLGDLNRHPQPDWIQLRRFVGMGGAVLMASDQFYGPGGFRSAPVTSADPAVQYQQFADCLRIRSLNRAHPLMNGIRELIVNRTGWIEPPADNSIAWEVIARLPMSCSPSDSSGQPLLVAGQTNRGPESRGIILLAADQSLFTNNMLWHGDNAILAIRVSEILCRGNRSKVLVQSDGQSLSSYRENPLIGETEAPAIPEELPEPELRTILRLANAIISNVEESNLLNELLMKQPRNLNPRHYQRIVLLAFAVLAALFLIWTFTQKSLVRPSPNTDRVMLSAHQLDRNQVTAADDYGTAAEILATTLCRELTGSDAPSEWQRWLNAVTEDSSRLPFVQNATNRRSLATVIDLAVRGRKAGISKRQFRSLGRQIQSLRELAQQGTLIVDSAD